MKRFLWSLASGGAGGGLTYWVTHDVGAAIIVGILVFCAVQFTGLGDVLEELGEAVGTAIGKGLDDI